MSKELFEKYDKSRGKLHLVDGIRSVSRPARLTGCEGMKRVLAKLGGLSVEVDVEQTRLIYAKIGKSGSEECDCAHYRNY